MSYKILHERRQTKSSWISTIHTVGVNKQTDLQQYYYEISKIKIRYEVKDKYLVTRSNLDE